MDTCFVLLTDFGLDDPYVGQMKCVLQHLAPGTPCIDLSHGVPPHAVSTGAFFLAASLPYLPPQAICLAVVDPGVGSERRILCANIAGRTIIAPDNGLLALALDLYPEGGTRLWHIHAAHRMHQRGGTFHGRDIMAPAAARLATGSDIAEMAEPIASGSIHMPPWSTPAQHGASLHLCVLHVDRFGNVILNLPASSDIRVQAIVIGDSVIPTSLATHYGAMAEGRVGLLRGSQGFWEIAANMSSASTLLGLGPGDTLRVECLSPRHIEPPIR